MRNYVSASDLVPVPVRGVARLFSQGGMCFAGGPVLREAKRDRACRALGRVTGGSGGAAPSGVQGWSPGGG